MSEAPITARPHVFYIRPAPGWLEIVFDEVTALAQAPLQKYKFEPKITSLKGTVKLHRCDWRQGLEIMLRLTTAHDVEWMILESKCTKWSEVDAILQRVPWNDVLPDREIPVHVTTDISGGFSTASAKLRENFCKISGLKHVSEGGELRFKIELRGDFLRISASLCGEPLYKRGYKANLSATAPLPEHQAAACTRWILAGSKDSLPVTSIFVPFAGSGTFGFEALLVLCGAGPGSFSRLFACDLFPGTPPATMKFLRRKLAERLSSAQHPHVLFNDFNADAISILKENIAGFPTNPSFEVIEGDFFDLQPKFSADGKILILLNPPYGDRLAKASSIIDLYARIGKRMHNLSREFPDRIIGGCLCPDDFSWRAFLKELNLPSAETRHFTHGGKEMRIVRFH
jgi:23S rRNA G2445 N2-methylase RlmL